MTRLAEHGSKTALWLAAVLITLLLTACSTAQAAKEVNAQKWLSSSHGDKAAPAFTAWDNGEVPENCAKCHSTPGYHDFLGVDGATAGQVDQPAATGTTVECEACHNEVAENKNRSVQPSGAELADLGQNATCMDCHQGRASGQSVDEAIGALADGTVSADLSLPNIHNNPAGPLQFGAEAGSGYEYAGQEYAGRYDHVLQFESCIDCHDPHSLAVEAEKCSACHLNVASADDLERIRVTNVDYDGDGDIKEGLAGEIETMREQLLMAIQFYAATNEALDAIVYEDNRPYFFDQNGEAYATWTPELLRAAYNYNYAARASGSYAHNAPYTIQLLYDSLDDLGANIFPLTRPASD